MYEVSFFGDWSRKAFPKMYPRYRPHAQWSKLVGRTHDSTYKLFRVGELATPTLQKFTEEGNSRMLEFEAQGFNGTLDSFTAAPIRNGVGRTSVRVMANGKYNRISFIVKIVPSPDWFVGIDNVDLCRAGRWRRRIHMTMRPLDGGTDKGLTYTSPNWPTHPQEPVYHILPTKPRHPASPFYNPKQEKVPKIAHVNMMEMATRRPYKCETVHMIPCNRSYWIFYIAVIKDCLVTQWGSWGPCSKTCGFGVRIRKRQIIQQEENGGTACPRVSVETLCGSMRTCGWKHFSMFAQHSPRRRRRRRHHQKSTNSYAPVHIRYRPAY
ncbi:hypothetical protein LOTGIDRAFT_217518 [Lottia gigantea]|uniref:Spondin domain-containing protein n=1 Tax=Lottia gigantea TaxID=225164 RepID=V3ZI86_LOTGI|nr:hypothetical protein LOTGIDRAFT_217518 [Lottia gigantea]ESO90983.1 hypothetical protein LOTGIDRAFT_217518 [Lottia gigantea]